MIIINKKRTQLIFVLSLLFSIFYSSFASAAFLCPSYIRNAVKGNYLYLYFPTSSDNTFPEYGTGDTSPLAAFDVSDLDSGIGTTAALRQRIFEIVTDSYCEFNIRVESSTSKPSPTASRWQIVGMGSDSESLWGGALFGEAQAVDTGDADGQDYARVWAQSFKDCYADGIAGVTECDGVPLSGTNSTLERWATAIGETTTHEAGHNYGLAHGDSAPRAGSNEDEQNNHIMATGSTNLTGEMRASRDRHFSDTSYEILGHNVGLNVQTVHNWDFINPNDTSANKLRIKLLSTASSLTVSWAYTGSMSPWSTPSVADSGTNVTFQGTSYNIFNLDFDTAQSWSGPTAGVIGAGEEFHVGVSFSGGGSVIVYETELFSGATTLALSPRLPGYDVGTADMATGDFAIAFFNATPDAGDLIIQNLVVRRVPRMIDINTMIDNARATDIRGIPVRERAGGRDFQTMRVKDQLKVAIANLSDDRTVDIIYGPEDCPKGSIGYDPDSESGGWGQTIFRGSAGDISGPQELKYCLKGNALSLFPSTYSYITATVIDPNARYWDKDIGEFVDGLLQSKIFYQVAGFVPDFNNNGVDDLIDIRTGTARDDNGNGVPDVAEGRTPWHNSFHVGATYPLDNLNDIADSNIHLRYDLGYRLNDRLEAMLMAGFSQFTAESSNGLDHPYWANLSLNIKGFLPTATGLVYYAEAGPGMYRSKSGSNDAGANIGVGGQIPLASPFTIEFGLDYHLINDDDDTRFLTFQLGVLFR